MNNSSDYNPVQREQKPPATVLWFLTGLFAFRMAAQLLQAFWPVDVLPDYDAWHSGTLSYGVLLGFQLVILIVMGVINLRLTFGRAGLRAQTAEVLLSLGSIFFAFMLFRLGAALTFAQDQPFLGKALPAVFHLVLSGWMLTLGAFTKLGSDAITTGSTPVSRQLTFVRWLAYPVIIAFCLWLHFVIAWAGLGLQFSTYLPVAFGAAVITILEKRYPCRREWLPDHDDVKNDLTFMVLVQVLLPKMLAFFVAITAINWLQDYGIVLKGWWPHGFSPLGQAGLMILVADFLRYWLHRASHEWSPRLWRLHAVHHSPHKLYWVNVGRFHPIEKSLQFLCDALPFILLGVTPEVLAIYFVFYAVNGFFQHCNIDLRLGWLNYVISGPELHRWHHSWEARESNKNYGNNVIVWDLLFGSFFLPHDRRVGQLGLRNRRYPLDFIRQMRTPFVEGLDQTEK